MFDLHSIHQLMLDLIDRKMLIVQLNNYLILLNRRISFFRLGSVFHLPRGQICSLRRENYRFREEEINFRTRLIELFDTRTRDGSIKLCGSEPVLLVKSPSSTRILVSKMQNAVLRLLVVGGYQTHEILTMIL